MIVVGNLAAALAFLIVILNPHGTRLVGLLVAQTVALILLWHRMLRLKAARTP
jgi:hypothetical protein